MSAEQLVGREIDGYRILAVLGRGGMGVVLKAEDLALGRLVAIKLIDPTYATDDTFLRRFRREARALARLRSPHIVTVHALRPTEVGLFIVMEYVDGDTLKEHFGSDPVSWQALFPVLRQVLGALDHAHSLDVVHRDIKPGNVMVTSDGEVKVMDFGIAKILSNDPGATITQGTIGTPHYMSPEQVTGERTIDGRSDLYSLAMTAYRLLAGRLPFEEDSNLLRIYRTIAEEDLPSPRTFNPAIPAGVEAVIEKALRKRPDDRFHTAGAMLTAFMQAEEESKRTEQEKKAVSVPPLKPDRRDGETVPAVPRHPRVATPAVPTETAAADVSRSATRRRWPLLGAAALLLGFLGMALMNWTGSDDGLPIAEADVSEAEMRDSSALTGKDGGGTVGTDSLPEPSEGSAPAAGDPLTEGNQQSEPRADETQVDDETPPAPDALEGRLIVRSDPPGASVRIDGTDRGTTPARLTLAPGAYRVRAEHDGYEPTETTLRVTDGGISDRTLSLALLPGALRVSVRPFGDVYIDGSLRQENVTFARSFELSAGAHTLRVDHAELGPWERSVVVPPDGTKRVEVDLREVPLTVTAFDREEQPVRGDIYVDGVSTGRPTPATVSVRVGQRRIEVRAEGYTGGAQTLTVSDQGRSAPLRLTLQKTDG